jgi:hypothetical protein
MFNMFQYFVYCFSLCPTYVQEKGDKRTYWVLDLQYYELLQTYLDFFLPRKPSISEMPGTPTGKLASTKQILEPLDDTCIFRCSAVENLSQALGTAQFFVESLIEMWLCQNDYELLESPGLKVPVYVKPNQHLLKGITILVKRLVDMDLSQVGGEQASRVFLDRASGQTHLIYDIHKTNTYKSLNVKLFRFLCSALQHWPNDDTIADVVEIWCLFAFPWKLRNQKYSSAWSHFVQDNFLYYTKMLQLFINRTLTFDFYASARPLTKKSNLQAVPVRYLAILEKVLECFADPALVDTIRSIEHALLSMKSYAPTPMIGSPVLGNKTPLLATPKTPKSTKDIGGQMYRNSGPRTRLSIAQFEGNYRYSPVFFLEESEREKTGGVANRVVARLWDTAERLKQIKALKNSINSRKPNQSSSYLQFLYDGFQMVFGSSESEESAKLNPEQLRLLDTNCNRIRNAIDGVCDLLGLVNPSVAPPMHMRRTASDLIGADDEGDISEWAPGICEPQRIRDMGNTLTLRGRNQVLDSH